MNIYITDAQNPSRPEANTTRTFEIDKDRLDFSRPAISQHPEARAYLESLHSAGRHLHIDAGPDSITFVVYRYADTPAFFGVTVNVSEKTGVVMAIAIKFGQRKYATIINTSPRPKIIMHRPASTVSIHEAEITAAAYDMAARIAQNVRLDSQMDDIQKTVAREIDRLSFKFFVL